MSKVIGFEPDSGPPDARFEVGCVGESNGAELVRPVNSGG